MSDQTTVSPATVSPATVSAAPAADGPGALRIVGLAAVGIGLAALAGAAFVLSYAGIHAFAVEAGISGRLARGYPLIFDVLLVVILAAVLALRGAGLPSKLLAWVCLLALLGAAAGADALHADGRKLPHQSAAVTAAIVPWVLVLIALALLLAMLRHARLRRLAGDRVTERGRARTRWETQQPPPASNQPLIPGLRPNESVVLTVPKSRPPTAEGRGVEERRVEERRVDERGVEERGRWTAAVSAPSMLAEPPAVQERAHAEAEPTIHGELAPDHPGTDAAPGGLAAESTEGQPGTGVDLDRADHDGASHARVDASDAEHESGDEESGDPGSPDGDVPEAGEAADPEMPFFHRMWSSPAPPAGE